MMLRNSQHAGELNWEQIRQLALSGKGSDDLAIAVNSCNSSTRPAALSPTVRSRTSARQRESKDPTQKTNNPGPRRSLHEDAPVFFVAASGDNIQHTTVT